MRKGTREAVLIVALIAAAVSVAAADPSNWDYSIAPRFWGASLALRYSIEPPTPDVVESSFWAGMSGAWETAGHYRNSDGSLLLPEKPISADASYNRVDLIVQLGFMQGFLARSDIAEDQAVFFATYRARFDYPIFDPNEDVSDLFRTSTLPEAAGSLVGSVVTGAAYSNVVVDPVLMSKSGVTAELAAELAPAFLHNQVLGAADYYRATLTLRGYLPIFSLEPDGQFNTLSIYAAAFGAVDWATGTQIPHAIRSSVGGRSPRSAIGGAVRGYELGRFDATFKVVANAEIRANLPALFLPGLLPGLLVYTDFGYFYNTGAVPPYPAEGSGYLFSSGAGVYFDVLDIFQLLFYTNVLWNETTIGKEPFVPFSLGFGFHY